ncbi:MAG TPA: prolipoprotein diacylglyceryl transferase, partial [Alphaproteobacteria bacterium]|nr:prolipoprotein diacylglyceryl transferase [Alphaproteobacteria bacterium]
YLFGIIFGYILCNYLNNNHSTKKINEKAIENLPLWVILSIILGGRIGYVLFYNFEYYLNNPAEILQVWQGGMAFHGGVIGVIIGIFVFSKMYREKFLQVTDLIAVVCPIGLFLGRCANFINMELVGRKCEYYQWCVIYPNENFARYPSQIFEAATEGVLLLLIMLVLAIKFKILNRTGYASAIFLMLYAVFRFACEFFREPDVQLGFIIEEITMGQVLSVFMFTIGLAVYFVSAKLLKQNKI